MITSIELKINLNILSWYDVTLKAFLVLTFVGPNASAAELTDFIHAAQVSRESDWSLPEDSRMVSFLKFYSIKLC